MHSYSKYLLSLSFVLSAFSAIAHTTHLRSVSRDVYSSFYDAMEVTPKTAGRLLEDGTCECSCGSNAAAEEKPEAIRLYVRGEAFYDVTIAERFSRRAKAYYDMTGIKVEVVRAPPEVDWGKELISLAGTAVYDGFYFFPVITGGLIEAGALADVSSYVGGELFDWNDVLPFVREQQAVFDGKVRMIPADAELHVLYYRKDLFNEHNVKVPRTWDEYTEIAKYFHGMEVPAADGNGTVTLVGSCVDRGFHAWLRNLLMTSVHAPTVVSKGTSQGIMFDAPSFTAGLGEAFAETLRHLENQARYGAEEELDIYRRSHESSNVRYFLREGRCALTYYWGDLFVNQFSDWSKVAGKVGVARVPGVTKVYDHEKRKLVKCTVDTCPHGVDYRDIGRVNYAPFVTGGGIATVATNLPKARETAMVNFLGFVCGQEESIKDVIAFPGNGSEAIAKPYRRSHLNVEAWVERGFPRETTAEYLQAISNTLGNPNAAKDERTPGAYWLKNLAGERSVNHLVRSKYENVTQNDRLQLAAEIEESWMEWIRAYDANRPPNSSSLKALYQKDMSVYFPPKDTKTLSSEDVAGLVVGCFVAASLLIGVIAWFIGRKRKNDYSMWVVKPEELRFDSPPVIIGRGAYGCVLLADYRGTQVAVKRVVPPKSALSSVTDSNSSGSQALFFLPFEVSNIGTNDSVHASCPQSMVLSGRLRITERKDIGDAALYRKRKRAFLKEIQYLSKLRHPCITTVMGAVVDPNTEPMLVLEYMQNGSLDDLLHNNTIILEKATLLSIVRDVSQGIRFLHAASPKVIHGDLKSANILVDNKLRAKVADFGLSGEDGHNKAIRGTQFWMAPELLRGECFNNASTDVYSFGIILYEVYSRRHPYEGEDPETVIAQVKDKKQNKRPPVPDDCPATLQSLMLDSLNGDPEGRPDFDEIDRRLKRVKVDDLKFETGSKEIVDYAEFRNFPGHIVDALREGREVEAEYHEMVTIFVADVDPSIECHPDKVQNLLGRLYAKFRTLAGTYGVFTVDTVSGSFMGVTNLVSDNPDDHAQRIAQFAIGALEAASQTPVDTDNSELGFASIRCGVHCGPVAANVVGRLKPRYCLVGDTVNTAGLLAATSEPGRVQCSDMACQLMRIQMPNIPLLERGFTPLEGKGEIYTFWMNEESKRPSDGSGNTSSSEV